jgi:16S rRNA (adenine1518-N6/adenine1519-N6)-dimethyltransferase
MLQREMADRIAAQPSTKSYGALSVLMQRHYQIKLLRKIPTAVFTPRPEVESAIVRLIPRAATELPPYDDELLVSLVRQGFSQRRKQLGKLLQKIIVDWPAAAEKFGLERTARAETLSLRQWIDLTNYVQPICPNESSDNPHETFPVVDGFDRVLYGCERSKVHGDNLRHRAVHILVFNGRGELFLQKRSRWKDRNPGVWDSSAAGHVLAGEEYDDAARREVREELGIEPALEKIGKLPASERTGQEFIWLYCARNDGELGLNRQEIEAGHFFEPAIVSGWSEARPDDFAPGFLDCWKLYQDRCR